MIQNNAEILKTKRAEGADLKEMVNEFAQVKIEKNLEASEAENDVATLQLELLEIQAAAERKEEAERKGKEVKEKMQEMTG